MFSQIFDYLNLDDAEITQLIISAILSVASTDEHLQMLKDWLENGKPFYLKDGKKVDVNAKISIKDKHYILTRISTSVKLNNEEFQKFLEDQLEEDKGNQDMVARCRLACEAAKYDKAIKNSFMDELMAPKCDRSIWEQVSIISTLMPKSQKDLIDPLIDRFFNEIHIVFKNRLRDERDNIYHNISPVKFASPEILEKFKALEASLDPESQKSLKMKTAEDIQSLEKILSGQKKYEASLVR